MGSLLKSVETSLDVVQLVVQAFEVVESSLATSEVDLDEDRGPLLT